MVSQRTKERAAYWADKLECPVDEHANYENTYVSSSSQDIQLGGDVNDVL
jgi:hypothetical protein